MRTVRRTSVVACAAVAFLTVNAAAKRVPPKPVSPVTSGGVRYSAEGDGRDQYVVAVDATSGNELWKVKVFHNRVKFWVEEDVQWVFITNLKLAYKLLLVRDERSRCYAVDLTKKRVNKQPCGTFSP